MRLMLTNYDGILAHGLECLQEAAQPLGEVVVVAPDREQSATSHSLTLHHPIRPVRRGERRWQVDGTPTDCVMLAVETLMPDRPHFVGCALLCGWRPSRGPDSLEEAGQSIDRFATPHHVAARVSAEHVTECQS